MVFRLPSEDLKTPIPLIFNHLYEHKDDLSLKIDRSIYYLDYLSIIIKEYRYRLSYPLVYSYPTPDTQSTTMSPQNIPTLTPDNQKLVLDYVDNPPHLGSTHRIYDYYASIRKQELPKEIVIDPTIRKLSQPILRYLSNQRLDAKFGDDLERTCYLDPKQIISFDTKANHLTGPIQSRPIPEEEQQLKLFTEKAASFKHGTVLTRSTEQFRSHWQRRFGRFFVGLDWSHLVVAGGSVLRALLNQEWHKYIPAYDRSDIDFFVYGLQDSPNIFEEQSRFFDIVKHLMETYARNIDEQPFVYVTKEAVTFVPRHSPGAPKVQLILRSNSCIGQVIHNFDVDCCGVAFDGQELWMTRRARVAIQTQRNCYDPSHFSKSYVYRLMKYSRRGFSVVVPCLPEILDLESLDIERCSKSGSFLGQLLWLSHRNSRFLAKVAKVAEKAEKRRTAELQHRLRKSLPTPPDSSVQIDSDEDSDDDPLIDTSDYDGLSEYDGDQDLISQVYRQLEKKSSLQEAYSWLIPYKDRFLNKLEPLKTGHILFTNLSRDNGHLFDFSQLNGLMFSTPISETSLVDMMKRSHAGKINNCSFICRARTSTITYQQRLDQVDKAYQPIRTSYLLYSHTSKVEVVEIPKIPKIASLPSVPKPVESTEQMNNDRIQAILRVTEQLTLLLEEMLKTQK